MDLFINIGIAVAFFSAGWFLRGLFGHNKAIIAAVEADTKAVANDVVKKASDFRKG